MIPSEKLFSWGLALSLARTRGILNGQTHSTDFISATGQSFLIIRTKITKKKQPRDSDFHCFQRSFVIHLSETTIVFRYSAKM